MNNLDQMLAEPRHFTVKEFHVMLEKEIIPPDERVELLEGIVIDMPPMGPFHVGVTAALSRFFTLAGPDRWLVMTQMPLKLSKQTELLPDIMLVPLQLLEFKTRTIVPEDVLLLIEVSDTTVRYDRQRKLPIYAAGGIAEVWIVNLADHFVEIHRDATPNGYTRVQQVRPGEFASPLAFPEIRVNVAELLERTR